MPQSFFDIIKDDPQRDALRELRQIKDAEARARRRKRIQARKDSKPTQQQRQFGAGIDWDDPKKAQEVKVYESLTEEVKEIIQLSIDGRDLTTADFYTANRLLFLSDDSKRAEKLKGFDKQFKQGGLFPALHDEFSKEYGRTTHYRIWLKELKNVYGSTSLGNKSLKRIRSYIMSPEKDEMLEAENIIDWAEEEASGIDNTEWVRFKGNTTEVEGKYESILEDLTESVRIINRYEQIAETAMENQKVLEMALETKLADEDAVKKVLGEIKLAISKYKEYIKSKYKNLKTFWRALKILNGRDRKLGIPQKYGEDLYDEKTTTPAKYKTISPAEYEDEDDPYKRTKDAVREEISPKKVERTKSAKKGDKRYNLQEIGPELLDDYLELARYSARDFIEDLGHEISIDVGEVKERLDNIMSDENRFKPLKDGEN